MRKLILSSIIVTSLLSSCGWGINDQMTLDATLPNTSAPSHLVGEWASGYTNFTQVINAYDGRHLGSTWQSGKYFKITRNGSNSEFYFMAKSQYSSSGTKAVGTIRFDVGSTNEKGAFTFLALKGHYKGWGPTMVDREATESELKTYLTGKYYYRMEGNWLRIESGAEPGEFASSFRKIVN